MAYDRTKETREVKALIDKNSRGDKIQIASVKHENVDVPWVDIRLMYTPEGATEIRPTSKGLRFSPDLLPGIVSALVNMMSDEEKAELAKSLSEGSAE